MRWLRFVVLLVVVLVLLGGGLYLGDGYAEKREARSGSRSNRSRIWTFSICARCAERACQAGESVRADMENDSSRFSVASQPNNIRDGAMASPCSGCSPILP